MNKENIIKVCGDPHCEALYHNIPKNITRCNDCNGRLIEINKKTYLKKYAFNFFQYDYFTMKYFRPLNNLLKNDVTQLNLF